MKNYEGVVDVLRRVETEGVRATLPLDLGVEQVGTLVLRTVNGSIYVVESVQEGGLIRSLTSGGRDVVITRINEKRLGQDKQPMYRHPSYLVGDELNDHDRYVFMRFVDEDGVQSLDLTPIIGASYLPPECTPEDAEAEVDPPK